MKIEIEFTTPEELAQQLESIFGLSEQKITNLKEQIEELETRLSIAQEANTRLRTLRELDNDKYRKWLVEIFGAVIGSTQGPYYGQDEQDIVLRGIGHIRATAIAKKKTADHL